jgi:tetratricopeptide (TPR) repeat protein
VKLKPGPVLNEQTYGLQFIDYTPYYWMGVCYLKTEDYPHALEMFKKEEDFGAIKKSAGLYKDLLKLRADASGAQNARLVREAQQEIQRLERESDDLSTKHSFQEALAKLAQAGEAAKALPDPESVRRITEKRNRIVATQNEIEEKTRKQQRIEQRLGEALRLLEEGKGTEAQAQMAFDDVLALDPQNARALEGRKIAQERIRASSTRSKLAELFQQGKQLFEAAQYEAALEPLTGATADLSNGAARDLLEKARKIVQDVQRQKELQVEIDKLMARGERLFADGQFPEAQVAFEAVLRLDPGKARAKERLTLAEGWTREAILERLFPNQPPELMLFWPEAREIESPTLTVRGVAIDDRGIAKIEFRVGGRLVAEQLPPPRLDSGKAQRNLPIERELQLEPGPNEVVVTATDGNGLSHSDTLQITRRLRFYETSLFVPSAAGGAVGLLALGFLGQRLRRRRAVHRRFNPYIAGAPVLDDDMFFGREKLTQRMLNVLHHNSLMITGERRIGKTTFLYHLKKVLAADAEGDYHFFPVFIDLQGVTEQGFFHALMSEVVDTLKLSPPTLASLRFGSEPEEYEGRDFSHDLQRVIEDLKTRTGRRVKLALLIDEVDVLNEYSERVNQRLRSIFMKTFSESLVAVMSGVGVKRAWTSEVSPWYNFFDEIEITGFTREEAEALIRTPVAGVFRYDPDAVERILDLSQMKPYLIQKFCIHAVNRMLEEGRTTVRSSDVEAARQVVMLEGRIATAATEGVSTHLPA